MARAIADRLNVAAQGLRGKSHARTRGEFFRPTLGSRPDPPNRMASTLALRTWLQDQATAHAEEMGFEPPAAPTVLDFICYRVSGGDSLRQITREMATAFDRRVPMDWLASYLRREHHDYESRMREARRLGAVALADESLELIDSAEPTPDALRKAQLQADVRRWQAERYARDDFGPSTRASVTLNVGTLHLDALRRRDAVAHLPNPDAA